MSIKSIITISKPVFGLFYKSNFQGVRKLSIILKEWTYRARQKGYFCDCRNSKLQCYDWW